MDNFLYCGLEARHPSWRAAALRLFCADATTQLAQIPDKAAYDQLKDIVALNSASVQRASRTSVSAC
jgi:hypothetical protein